MATTNRQRCDYSGCDKVSHAKTGPCSMHYYRERRASDPNSRRAYDFDYNDFWLFVKKHVLWDGDGHPIGVKAGLNRDWRH
jgi:hypothetical protein